MSKLKISQSDFNFYGHKYEKSKLVSASNSIVSLGRATIFGDFAHFEIWREHYHTKILMNFFVGFLTNRLRFVPQEFSFQSFI